MFMALCLDHKQFTFNLYAYKALIIFRAEDGIRYSMFYITRVTLKQRFTT